MKRHIKKGLMIGATSITLAGMGLSAGISYLYHVAIARNDKTFMQGDEASGVEESEQPITQWDFLEQPAQTLIQRTADHLLLKAYGLYHCYSKQKHHKVMILLHGYTSNALLLRTYAKIFYENGYDVILPDARGHGRSEGAYIGFGWPDRKDVHGWIQQVIQSYHGEVSVGIWGISMGAATAMMAADGTLPHQVKCIVEDCGYTSTEDELTYQLKHMYHLPKYPIIPLASAYTQWKAGYNFEESNALKQLRHNNIPMLFIHGTRDSFVPFSMVQPLYQATKGPKELVVFPYATHAKSYQSDPKRYQHHVLAFLRRYM